MNYPDSIIKMIRGDGGIFEVKCNDELIYSKESTQRFPGEGEITRLIKQKMR